MSKRAIYRTRRDVLAGGLRVISGACTVPLFLGRTAWALDADAAPGRKNDGRILVVVQLSGGNDGLNTIIPVEDNRYYALRRRLAIPRRDALKLEQGLALHPSLTALKAQYDAGRVAIVQGVGYPNPNRSHFVSMDVWHTADPGLRAREGWLGRYVDATCRGADPAPPTQAVALADETPLALRGERFTPLALRRPEDLRWAGARRDRAAEAAFRQLNSTDTLPDGCGEYHQFLLRAGSTALLAADEIAGAARRRMRRFGGGNLGRQLQLVAQMIQHDLPTRIYYVSLGGFDTHVNQLGTHARLLEQFSAALSDFLDSMERAGLLDRVLVLCFSEFGRRVAANASAGTDHGEAGPVFLAGGNVRPGLHGRHPSLEELHRGDLAFQIDFRRIYATVVQHWFDASARRVLGRGIGPMRLLQRS